MALLPIYTQFCDVEDLLAERGIIVSYETIRQWCQKFGLSCARNLRKKQHKLGDTWFLDEVFLNINGKRQYLWRAVDQDGDVVDILVQSRRNKKAACHFFPKMLKRQGTPCKIVTDKLRSYSAARKEVIPSVMHCQDQYAIIMRKAHINAPGSENDKCGVSNPPGKRNDFSPCIAKYTIYLTLVVIY